MVTKKRATAPGNRWRGPRRREARHFATDKEAHRFARSESRQARAKRRHTQERRVARPGVVMVSRTVRMDIKPTARHVINVGTFNVYQWNSAGPDAIAAELLSADLDVVGLQEVG